MAFRTASSDHSDASVAGVLRSGIPTKDGVEPPDERS